MMKRIIARPNQAADAKNPEVISFSGLSSVDEICLVDDDHMINLVNGKVINKMLPHIPLRIFGSVDEGLRHIRQKPQSRRFIFLDLNFPYKSGWDFLAEFVKLKALFSKVVLSSSIDPEDHEKAKAYKEVLGFYSKPLTLVAMEDLKSRMNQLGY
jgi:response regulator of citrate/malate metabolism